MTPAEINVLLQVVGWLGWALVGLLTFLGIRMYNDMRHVKENWVSKRDLADELTKLRTEQRMRHKSNGRKFEAINASIDELVQTSHATRLVVEQRVGEVRELVASLRSHPPAGQPERRRGYGSSES